MATLSGHWQRYQLNLHLRNASEVVLEKISAFLADKNILASLQWYKNDFDVILLSVMGFGSQIVGVNAEDEIIVSADLPQIIQQLEDDFDVEVTSVAQNLEFITKDESPVSANSQVISNYKSCVIITQTPASVFPILSNIEGADLAVVELGDNKRAVMQSVPSDQELSLLQLCEAPYVAFCRIGEKYKFFYTFAEDTQDFIDFTWDMNLKLVYGLSARPSRSLEYVVREMLLPYRRDLDISTIVDGLNPKKVRQAMYSSGAEGVPMLMSEFGLSKEIIEFLQGKLVAHEIPNATSHQDRGLVNAITRSFDVETQEVNGTVARGFWALYKKIAFEKPGVLHLISTLELLGGAYILYRSWYKQNKTIGTALGFMVGAWLMLEGVSETMLTKYVARKEERRMSSQSDW